MSLARLSLLNQELKGLSIVNLHEDVGIFYCFFFFLIEISGLSFQDV